MTANFKPLSSLSVLLLLACSGTPDATPGGVVGLSEPGTAAGAVNSENGQTATGPGAVDPATGLPVAPGAVDPATGLPVAPGAGQGATGANPAAPVDPANPVQPIPGQAPGELPNGCAEAKAPILTSRQLTPKQYGNIVSDLFKVDSATAKSFTGNPLGTLDEVAVERRSNAAEEVARAAVANLAAWAPCTTGDAACAAQVIDSIGTRAYRRPLTDTERTQMQTLFDAGNAENGFEMGVEWLLTGLLQSPHFLYQFAKPAAGEVAGQVTQLEPYELASRLSLFVWDTLPDDELMQAAAGGLLADQAMVSTQLNRMVQHPNFKRGVESFYSGWLKLKAFEELARQDDALTADLTLTLAESLLRGATSVYDTPAPTLESLMTGDTYYMDAEMRSFYGLEGGGAELEPVQLAGEGRHGLLTHPSLMALLARPTETSPINRGLFVQGTILCNEVPHPPEDLAIPNLSPPSPDRTTRDRLSEHTENPGCAGCHAIIDPPGFALENYDFVGRYRAVESGKAVDTSGTLVSAGDVGGPFANGAELLARIANSAQAKTCFAQQYLSHALLRPLTTEPADQCALDNITRSFAPTGDLRQLVVAIAGTDSFRMRATEAASAAGVNQ